MLPKSSVTRPPQPHPLQPIGCNWKELAELANFSDTTVAMETMRLLENQGLLPPH